MRSSADSCVGSVVEVEAATGWGGGWYPGMLAPRGGGGGGGSDEVLKWLPDSSDMCPENERSGSLPKSRSDVGMDGSPHCALEPEVSCE